MHPLMRFYLFIFLLLLSSGIFTFFLCAIDSLTYFPIIVNLPPTFKILLGTEQVWMMLELALRIRQCNLIDLDEGQRKKAYAATERYIKFGRFLAISIEVVVFLTSASIQLSLFLSTAHRDYSTRQRTATIDNYMGHFFFMCFAILLIAIFIALTTLIYFLKKKGLQLFSSSPGALNAKSNDMRHETCQIAIIITTFSLSFIFEMAWDWIFTSLQEMGFLVYMLWLSSTLFFDYLPITAILLLHRRNFKTIQTPRTTSISDTETMETLQNSTSSVIQLQYNMTEVDSTSNNNVSPTASIVKHNNMLLFGEK